MSTRFDACGWVVITRQFPKDWFEMRHRPNSTLIGKIFPIQHVARAGNPVADIDGYIMPLHVDCVKTFDDREEAEQYAKKISVLL